MRKPIPEATVKSKILWTIYVLVFFAMFTAGAVAMLTPLQFKGGDPEEVLACQRNLEKLMNAAMQYAEDNDGVLPGRDWVQALKKYETDPVSYACPRQRRMDPKSSGYALNELVIGKKLDKLSPNMVVFFDSEATDMGHVGDPRDCPIPGRHRAGAFNNVAYVTGAARATPAR